MWRLQWHRKTIIAANNFSSMPVLRCTQFTGGKGEKRRGVLEGQEKRKFWFSFAFSLSLSLHKTCSECLFGIKLEISKHKFLWQPAKYFSGKPWFTSEKILSGTQVVWAKKKIDSLTGSNYFSKSSACVCVSPQTGPWERLTCKWIICLIFSKER